MHFRKLILLQVLFVFVFTNTILSQTTFQKECGGQFNGNVGRSVQQTYDGNYIFAGLAGSFGSNGEAYLIRTNTDGDTLWTKYFGHGGQDDAYSVLQSFDSTYMVLGFSGGGVGMCLTKVDTFGQILWSKSFGGTGIDWGTCLVQTKDSGFILTGVTSSFGAGGKDIYVIRTDASGSVIWSRTYGGALDDWGETICPTSDGGFVLSGSTSSFGAGNSDLYLLKIDSTGNLQWASSFGGVQNDWGRSAIQSWNGGYVLAGTTSSFGTGRIDGYLLKTDTGGNLLWSYTYGTAGDDNIFDMQQTNDGGYVLCGYSYTVDNSDVSAYMLKISPSGDTIWTRAFAGSSANAVRQTTDGGFILTGDSDFGTGLGSVYLLKTDAFGNTSCPLKVRVTQIGFPQTQANFTSTLVNAPMTIVNYSMPTVEGRNGDLAVGCLTTDLNNSNSEMEVLEIFPNPVHAVFTLKLNEELLNCQVEILDSFGRIISEYFYPMLASCEIQLPQESPGIYLVRIHNQKFCVSNKISVY